MNKKILLLFAIVLMSISAMQAQIQVGKYAFNNTVRSIVNDASGNTYVGGEFTPNYAIGFAEGKFYRVSWGYPDLQIVYKFL